MSTHTVTAFGPRATMDVRIAHIGLIVARESRGASHVVVAQKRPLIREGWFSEREVGVMYVLQVEGPASLAQAVAGLLDA